MSEVTLNEDEPHPSAMYAMRYVKANLLPIHIESLSSTALSGNRSAEIMLSTVRRLNNGDPVSDRYLLGLAWWLAFIKNDITEAAPSTRQEEGL